MRLVFMGTPRFAVPPLQALAKAGHDVAGVVTRIDKPAGRGRAMAQPAVKIAALEIGLAVYQPKRVRDADVIEILRRLAPEVIVVAAYGQILPREILALPKYGCINIHASLLPLYRGAAPINWAIIHGETRTGNTIMRMEEGLDTGPILLQESIPIDPKDTAGTLTEKLSALGAKLIIAALPLIEAGKIRPEPQDSSRATLAPLLRKEDGLIDWKLSAQQIHNQVRGVTPWPGALTFLDENMVKILETETLQGRGDPGRLYEGMQGSLDVGTGSGLLRIIRLQQAGKKPMVTADFLRGHRGIEGKKFTIERRTHGSKV
jgi:methionyl-tRNA formyltransferase